MATEKPNDPSDETPELKGHAIGMVDTPEACAALTEALNSAGFSAERIMVFRGDEGIQRLHDMMEGSLWGESAEKLLKQATAELQLGHSVVCVQVRDEQEAATVASISTQHGGHSVFHFGPTVDTRLTA